MADTVELMNQLDTDKNEHISWQEWSHACAVWLHDMGELSPHAFRSAVGHHVPWLEIVTPAAGRRAQSHSSAQSQCPACSSSRAQRAALLP